jgi:hypothetical protein
MITKKNKTRNNIIRKISGKYVKSEPGLILLYKEIRRTQSAICSLNKLLDEFIKDKYHLPYYGHSDCSTPSHSFKAYKNHQSSNENIQDKEFDKHQKPLIILIVCFVLVILFICSGAIYHFYH